MNMMEAKTQMTDMRTFARRLRDVRMMLGFTQKEVAEFSGISPLNVSRIETSGKVRSGIFFRLVSFYSIHISIDMLLDDKAWLSAMEDKDLLLRKPYMNSSVVEKLRIMEEHVRKNIAEEKAKISHDLNILQNKLIRGLDSAITLAEE